MRMAKTAAGCWPESNAFVMVDVRKPGIGHVTERLDSWRDSKFRTLKGILPGATLKTRAETKREYYLKYPWAKTRTYIKKRCCQKNSSHYKYYGGRGIECRITSSELKELWFRDKAHLLEIPSIDRINPDGHYELNNCRYMEKSENRGTAKRKLNSKSVLSIRKEYEEKRGSYTTLAIKYKISRVMLWRVLKRKSWANV